MADTLTLNAGSGGSTLATDDCAGVHYQRVKLADGTADSTTLINAGGGVEANALRVTIANDSTGVVSVDDNGASLTVDNAALSVVGGGVEATALRVTLASDSTGVISVDDNGGTLTVDNAALSVTGGGVEASALRVTIATDSTGVVSIDDNGGSVTVDGTVTANAGTGTFTIAGAVTNAGTFATQESGAALTALQLIDDAIIADDAAFTPATTKVMMAGFEYDDTTPDSVNEGDAGAARMSANRNIYTTIRDAAGNERGLNVAADGSIAITVATIPSHAVTNAGTFATQVSSIAAGDNNIGNVDVVTLPNVTLAAGTNTNEVVGDAAHDAAIAGNPVRIAGRALTADYTSVATGDTADLITTVGGKLITHPYALPENYVSGATSDMTATTSTSVVAAAGAGLRNYITHIVVQNSHATVGTWVNIQDGSGGTTLYTVYAAALGGGAAMTLPCPIKTTANTALYCANVTTGANTRVSASGYKAP